MKLTETEREMLNGRQGEGLRTAMEIIVRMGDLYGAKRLLPVKRAHIDAAAYTTVWEAGSDFIVYLAEHGAVCSVPTTINPVSRDIEKWDKLGASVRFAEKSRRLEEAYLKMGVIPTWTCAPYQEKNVPRFGEIVSWSESNAVCYVNSVLGARAERLPDLMDVCCAVTGRVPEYGRYLDENRKGEVLFQLQGFAPDAFTEPDLSALLGYYIGEIAGSRVPVIDGMTGSVPPECLKALCAAAATGGAVSLFHIIGKTPEAPTPKAVHRGRKVPTHAVTPRELETLRQKLKTTKGNRADMIVLGCPHFSEAELHRTAQLVRGRKVNPHCELWIMTSRAEAQKAETAGDLQALKAAGAIITRDTCLMEMEEGNGRWRGKNMLTNSGKAVQYMPAICGVNGMISSLKDCVEAAVSGLLPGTGERSANETGQV